MFAPLRQLFWLFLALMVAVPVVTWSVIVGYDLWEKALPLIFRNRVDLAPSRPILFLPALLLMLGPLGLGLLAWLKAFPHATGKRKALFGLAYLPLLSALCAAFVFWVFIHSRP